LKVVPGFGLGTTLHVEPSQCRVRVTGPDLPPVHPTAQMSFVEIATTPYRRGTEPAGGPGTMLHCVPFQCKINGAEGSARPTAQSSLGEPGTAVTAVRLLCCLGTFGLGTTLQLVPSQCSTSVWLSPLSPVVLPTAQTLL